nr:YvrJ family protein [Desemzia sp. C1]
MNFIGNVGFPIFITIYLLMRLEKIISKMTEALTELKESIYKE